MIDAPPRHWMEDTDDTDMIMAEKVIIYDAELQMSVWAMRGWGF